MSTSTVTEDAIQQHITSDQALKSARMGAENVYRDLSPYRILVELYQDGWHVDFELKNLSSHGGGPHYVIDSAVGTIRSKRYEQ